MIEGQPISGDGLYKSSQETALYLKPLSEGKMWFTYDGQISLAYFTKPKTTFEGCMIDWHSAAAKGSVINYRDLISNFDERADALVADSDFENILTCPYSAGKYERVLRTSTERKTYVRLALHIFEDIKFVLLVAGESDISEDERLNEANPYTPICDD